MNCYFRFNWCYYYQYNYHIFINTQSLLKYSKKLSRMSYNSFKYQVHTGFSTSIYLCCCSILHNLECKSMSHLLHSIELECTLLMMIYSNLNQLYYHIFAPYNIIHFLKNSMYLLNSKFHLDFYLRMCHRMSYTIYRRYCSMNTNLQSRKHCNLHRIECCTMFNHQYSYTWKLHYHNKLSCNYYM